MPEARMIVRQSRRTREASCSSAACDRGIPPRDLHLPVYVQQNVRQPPDQRATSEEVPGTHQQRGTASVPPQGQDRAEPEV